MPRLPIDPQHESTSSGLTTVGIVLIVVGGIFAIGGLVDLFRDFSSFGSSQFGGASQAPTRIWCLFVGLPMFAIGAKILFFGNMGRIARYMSHEITPVSTDTFKYAVGETRDSVRDIASAVGEGLGLRLEVPADLRCPKCDHANDRDAQFCSGCGTALAAERACPACGHGNSAAARFCDQCGQSL